MNHRPVAQLARQRPYTVAMRQDPLSYLADELDSLKSQGLYRRLRVLEDEQRAWDKAQDRRGVRKQRPR